MPVILNLQSDLVRAANITMALAFYPRTRQWLFPKICGSTVSTSLIEPFVMDGSGPLPVLFQGYMASQGVPSYTFSVPNLLFKSVENLARSAIEGDQTGGLVLRRVQQIGIRTAAVPDFLFAKRIMGGSTAANVTVTFEGQKLTTTMDGLSYFNTAHATNPSGAAQSNIIQGTLPNSILGIQNQDVATTANQLQRDYQAVLSAFMSFVDTQGVNFYNNMEPEKSLVVALPPILWPAAELAFRVNGTIGGTAGSSSGATTSIGPKMVRDVLMSGLLAGCRDVESGGTISPLNVTDVEYFIVDDYVRPMYLQKYRLLKPGETRPPGNDLNAESQAALNSANELGFKVTADAAMMYAETIVESNLNAVGANAQTSVMENEQFEMSGRTRFNIAYGPWFTGIRVIPVGGIVSN